MKEHRKPLYRRDYAIVAITDPVAQKLEKMIEEAKIMSKPFTLQSESPPDWQFETRSEHDSYDEAVEAAGKLFDAGDEGDFRIVDNSTGRAWRLSGHTFQKSPARCVDVKPEFVR